MIMFKNIEKEHFVYSFWCLKIIKTTSRALGGTPKRNKDLPNSFGWPPLVTWATVAVATPALHSRSNQVAQLSQVQLCLCSLGNYGKYYCSLSPWFCSVSELSLDIQPKLIHTEWDPVRKNKSSVQLICTSFTCFYSESRQNWTSLLTLLDNSV